MLFTLPPVGKPPVAAERVVYAEPVGTAPVILDGQPLTEQDDLGYQHR